MGILLSDIFDSRSVILNLGCKTKEAAFDELSAAIASVHPECDRALMLAALWEREYKMSTGIASGVAIPHAFYRGMHNIAGAIGISRTGIAYDALDQKPVYVVFMLVMGIPVEENHLRVLNKISMLAQSEALAQLRNAKDTKDIQAILSRFH